jgi:transposase
VLRKAGLSCEADPENYLGGSSQTMYFIGLDIHKKTISYCVKDAASRVHQEGKIGSSRLELDDWIRAMPQPARLPWKRRSLRVGFTITCFLMPRR